MKNQNVLALDLATKTGYAYRLRDGTVGHGIINMKAKEGQQQGQRWVNFSQGLMDLLSSHNIQHVGFEQIDNFAPMKTQGGRYTIPSSAIITIAGCRSILERTCALNNIPLEGVHIGTIKKNWTGAGNVKKDRMIAEAFKRGYKPMDDNAADALAILDLILQPYGGLENGSEI